MESYLDVAKKAAELADQLPEQYREPAFRWFLDRGVVSASPMNATQAGNGVQSNGLVGISLGEFVNKLSQEPTSNPQKMCAVVYYHQTCVREESVTQAEITAYMRQAGWRPPGNFHRDMQVATGSRNALLMPAAQPKDESPAWQVTRTGRQFIESRTQRPD